jgi:predicted Zn-ribbon and HTH transcriptional regulator
MSRSLGEAVRRLRRVRCSACGREFLSNARPPRLCPACKRTGRVLAALRKLTRS